MFFLWYLLIGLFAGWIANLIVRGGGSGLIINLIVGLVGGLLGGWIFSWFGWVPESTFGSIKCSIIGAYTFLLFTSLQSTSPSDAGSLSPLRAADCFFYIFS